MLVQGVTSLNGFEAWGKLYRRYNPVTPARALQAMIGVMVPGRVKDIRELPGEIEKWEGKVLMLVREYQENLSERMKVAAVTSMCPPDVQDLIFQQGDKLDNYSKVRDQIKALCLNRASRVNGPTPMDIGLASQESSGSMWDSMEEWDVDAVGGGAQCYNCGGYGHFSRECPSKGKGKGKGKGGEGKGKAKGKGKEKGKGKSAIDTTCWTCGKSGHRSFECPQNRRVGSVEESDNSGEGQETPTDLEAGGVFWLNAISKEQSTTEKKSYLVAAKAGMLSAIAGNAAMKDPKDAQAAIAGRASFSIFRKCANQGGCSKSGCCVKTQNRYSALDEDMEAIQVPVRTATQDHAIQGAAAADTPLLTPPPPKAFRKEMDICAMDSKEADIVGKITIDSGAADSVLPRDMLASEFPLLPKQEGVRFVAANGNVIGNYGRRNLAFRTKGRSGVNCMTFHVTDVKKPLASVSKMVEKGSSVHFTPNGSYIQGPKGEKIELVRENGVYVMDVKFMSGFTGRA